MFDFFKRFREFKEKLKQRSTIIMGYPSSGTEYRRIPEYDAMKFLVQKMDGKIVHDFAFELIRSKDYYNWLDEPISVSYTDDLSFRNLTNPEGLVPVGSVEFVSSFLRKFFPSSASSLRPLNVPEDLFSFAGRKITNVYKREDFATFRNLDELYCKSLDTIKSQFNGPVYDIQKSFEAKDFRGFQVSELIDIVSEWRVFIFDGQILHIANYAGDCLSFPNPDTIKEMVRAYKSAPSVYTLDVAVKDSGETVVIECHRFFSCGLYGFSDYRRLPVMFTRAWKEMIR